MKIFFWLSKLSPTAMDEQVLPEPNPWYNNSPR